MKKREKIFLIDGTALFYRSFFAFIRNPMVNSKGENTSAIFGFASSLIKILSEEKPDYLAVVFDTKEPTFRHKKYKDYKATREKMPDEMVDQFPRILELVEAFEIPYIEMPGYEADDVIATLARMAEGKGIETFMVTGDKDFMQLISPLTKMYVTRPGKEVEIYDLKVLKEKFDFTPPQVIDYLALMGDSSDNIPGVAGVGEKTAKTLISEYNSLDNLYKNLDKVTQKGLHQKLAEGRDLAYLSRELVIIDQQVPLEAKFEQMKSQKVEGKKLRVLFEELEFRVLMDRLSEFIGGEEAIQKDIETTKQQYQLINTRQKLIELIDKIKKSKFFVFDTETTGLNVFDSQIIGISICLKAQQAFYIPLNDTSSDYQEREVFDLLRMVFESEHIKKGGQNIKFDGLMLGQHQIDLRGIHFDTMIAHYLIQPGTRQHNLDYLAHTYLNYKMIPIESLIGEKGKKQKSMAEIPVEKVCPYACEDADITYQLKEILEKQLKETHTLALFETLEMPLVRVLQQMEKHGVSIDVEFLQNMSKELEQNLQQVEKEIYQMAGNEFNINSPQQLGKILFEDMEIHKELGSRRPTKTATGQFSTSEQVLERFADHPMVNKILDYRKYAKLKSTYVDALASLISQRTGRLHTSFNQTIAATGRLSSSDPNLQNIPIRTEIGRKTRQAFVPGNPKDWIMSADYSQIELRIMAHLSGDAGLQKAFEKGEDIHASTASAVFDIPLKEVDTDQRRKAKEVNFGIIYGISQYGLANRLRITPDEAQDIIQNYFVRFPRVNDYMIHTIAFAQKNKYVKTIRDRRRYIPEIDSKNAHVRQNAERMAINTTIQGSAADLIKLAMINIQNQFEQKKLTCKMILQVHDELVFEVPDREVEQIRTLVKKEMENAIKLDVPIKVEIGKGKNWLEAH